MAKTTQTKNRSTKQQPAATAHAGTRQAQDSMNRLYVAHQVHTLANVLFHHIAMSGQDAWGCGGMRPVQPPGFGYSAPWSATSGPAAGAAHPGATQPLLYWYP
jgi:hypothetical protein